MYISIMRSDFHIIIDSDDTKTSIKGKDKNIEDSKTQKQKAHWTMKKAVH